MTTPRRYLRFLYETLRAGLARTFGLTADKRVGAERDAAWYDVSFALFPHWKKHYSESRYFFLWSIVADRLVKDGHSTVLDIGCGPGQFACLLRDRGLPSYYGLDFSLRRISQARTLCPEYHFYAEDAFSTGLFRDLNYHAVVMTEVLEHVERDLELVRRAAPGVRLLATVPNFPSAGHVRHFCSVGEVSERYGELLENCRVDPLQGDSRGKVYYLIDGRRRR